MFNNNTKVIYGSVKIRYAKPECLDDATYVAEDGWSYLIGKVLTICVNTVFIDKDTVSNAVEDLRINAKIELRYSEVKFVVNAAYLQNKPIVEKLYYTTINLEQLNNWMGSSKKSKADYVPPMNIYDGTHVKQRKVSLFTEVQPITLLNLLKAGVTTIRTLLAPSRTIIELDIADFIEMCRFKWQYPKKIINPFLWNIKNAFAELVEYPSNYASGEHGYFKYEGRGCDVHSDVPQPGTNYKYTVAYDKTKSSMVPTVMRAPEGGEYIEMMVSFFNSIPAPYRMYYVEQGSDVCLIGYQRVYTSAEKKANKLHVNKYLETPKAKALRATAWLFDVLGTTTAEDISQMITSGITWHDLVMHALEYETYSFGSELKLHQCISHLVSYNVISIDDLPDIYTYEPNGLTGIGEDHNVKRLAYDANEKEFLVYDEYEYKRYADERSKDDLSEDYYDDKSNDEITYGGK